ncbi:MAG: anthranilate synthase component I [Chloroflexi bacterium]|nr:MAG: anthranilate synthase component I [Chloroflexota bacterium]
MLLEATATQTTPARAPGASVIREITADLETPVSLYLKLRGDGASFLLESVEGGERIARYSFIGVQPRAEYILRDGQVEVKENGTTRVVQLDGDPTRFLQEEMSRFSTERLPNAPRFTGGLVGYLGYESVRYFEPTLQPGMARADTPDGMYLLADTVVAFDHARRSIFLIANVLDGDAEAANQKLDRIAERIRQPLPAANKVHVTPSEISLNMTPDRFEAMVREAKEHIAAGDIFQVVLSQRFTRETSVEAFDVYRAVRRLNPSPYMFFFDFGLMDGEPYYLVGSSPEMFVRLEGRTATLRPLAGSRPRGADADADAALAKELLADPKERAEHVMLVDLGRNDLGRVCEYGTIKVSDFFTIERYSHVMHIVSHVEGTLRRGLTAFDLVRAAFPAGTVSGAPKVRAMEIISELESDPRGAYAGMIGYFGFDGAMDTCLAIRTMIGRGRTVSVQAGAGIVADSDPTTEFQETVNKASAMLRAIDMAETNS